MPAVKLNIPIKKDYSITDVENELSKLTNSITDVCFLLPRNHQKKLFKDSWITSLISTASNGRRLKITEWNSSVLVKKSTTKGKN